jgi:Fe2+ or Zn2+ uptake regulation protein
MNTWPKELKRTKARLAVYGLLAQELRPLSPKEIHAKLGEAELWLSSVYRVLGQFEKANMVVRSNGVDLQNNLYELDPHEHKHYAVCIKCRTRFDLKDCPLNEEVEVNAKGFVVTEHRVEVLGYCATCMDALKKGSK